MSKYYAYTQSPDAGQHIHVFGSRYARGLYIQRTANTRAVTASEARQLWDGRRVVRFEECTDALAATWPREALACGLR